MSIKNIHVHGLMELKGRYPVLDVRSPGEYAAAHIPGAHNLPLFSDEERKVVGTAYKQQSRQQAIKTGLMYFGPKMVTLISEVERLCESYAAVNPQGGAEKAVIVHCWRGGMRSAGVGWLLDLYGFTVYTLSGGYKNFRRWCHEQFLKEFPIAIIGGYTGSGKTAILKILEKAGNAIVNLEELASHKGSAFGSFGEAPQPSQEMFENKLALSLYAASAADCIWIEDESQRIGNIIIPNNLFRTIQNMPVYFLDIPFNERLNTLVISYGVYEKDKLAGAITRIQKRLGGLETKTALACLQDNDLEGCFTILLKYYDRLYLKGLQHKGKTVPFVKKVLCDTTDAVANAQAVIQHHTAPAI